MNDATFHAIETNYAGCLFRSRLEARWAVFFDHAGIEWQYEPQGFENDKGDRYLPDFYLPLTKTWVEVKGDSQALCKEWERMSRLLDFGGVLPDFERSYGSDRGLLLLGDIPSPQWGLQFHPIIQHTKGLWRTWGVFSCGNGRPGRWSRLEIGDLGKLFDPDLYDGIGLDASPEGWEIGTIFVPTKYGWNRTQDAYAAARMARFEHGETPARPATDGGQ